MNRPGGGLSFEDYRHHPKTTNDHWYFAVEQSWRREIREEVNVEVGRLDYLLDMAYLRADGVPVIILSFFGPYKSQGIYNWIAISLITGGSPGHKRQTWMSLRDC